MPGQFLNAAEQSELIRITERQGDAFCTCSGRSADSMHVAFGFIGQLIVDDMRNSVHVNTAGHDVGGHQDFDTPLIEVCQGLLTRVLALVGVDRICRDAVLGELLG